MHVYIQNTYIHDWCTIGLIAEQTTSTCTCILTQDFMIDLGHELSPWTYK